MNVYISMYYGCLYLHRYLRCIPLPYLNRVEYRWYAYFCRRCEGSKTKSLVICMFNHRIQITQISQHLGQQDTGETLVQEIPITKLQERGCSNYLTCYIWRFL